MSEYQYVAFRAIDGPVTEKNLRYMEQQSTRAEITPWTFDNEYHYGGFHGNALEMLRRGYDIHLHYANFGVRKLLIRLPQGLPDARACKPYIGSDSLEFLKDKQGPGGTLAVEPYQESGDLEDLWDVDLILERLSPLRAEILDGDLRPFYLAHLAVACDSNHDPEETTEGPVPAGLDSLTDAQRALAELYGLDKALISACARQSPPLPTRTGGAKQYSNWLGKQSAAAKDAWLGSIMSDLHSAARSQMLAQYRSDRKVDAWPTTASSRTLAQLLAEAKEIRSAAKQKAAKAAARKREKRLAEMAANPDATLRKTEQLVAERNRDAYERAGKLLADLREALAQSGRATLVDKHVQKLKAANPTLRTLTSELRRRGLLPK